MNHVFRLLFITVLAVGMAACDETSVASPTPPSQPTNPANPTDPNNPEDPNEPSNPANPKSNDGLEQLLASANSSGEVSATISYEVDTSIVTSFVNRNDQAIQLIQASFNLKTQDGKPFKALGLIQLKSADGLKDGNSSFTATGELSFIGQVETVNGLKMIRASTEMPTLDGNGRVGVSLIMLRTADQLVGDDIGIPFLAKYKVNYSLGFTQKAASPTGFVSDYGWGGFSFSGKNEDGSDFIGFGIIDADAGFTEQEGSAELQMLAQALETPYGEVQRLKAKLTDPNGILLFDEADAYAVGFNLKAQTPEETVVIACSDCESDIIVSMARSGLSTFTANDDLWVQLNKLNPIPSWTVSKLLPVSKDATCEELSETFAEGVYISNLYRRYHKNLEQGGASLILVAKGSVKELKPGTATHQETLEEYLKISQVSWEVLTTLAERGREQKCF